VALVVFAVAVLTYMPFVMALNKATEVEAPKGDTLSE
jgi:cellobiose-specific phosphotransferase system component IIC